MKPYDIESFAKSMDATPDDLLPLMSSFLEEGQSELTLLEEAIADNKMTEIKSIAHNLKGISANLEMDELFVWCKEMDSAAKAGIQTEFSDYLESMKKEYKILADIIRTYYNI